MSKLGTQVKKLSLQKGDILVIQKSFSITPNWSAILQQAGKEAGVDFNVPVVFVDNIDELAIVRMGENG